MLSNDIDKRQAELLRRAPWMAQLDPVRFGIHAEHGVSDGVHGLLGFKNTLAMVKAGDYVDAPAGMLHSKWATQTPARAAPVQANEIGGVAMICQIKAHAWPLLAVLLMVSVSGNTVLAWAYLGQRDATTAARTAILGAERERDGARVAAQACSDGAEGAAAQRQAQAEPACADYTLSTAPAAFGDACASAQALGSVWLKGASHDARRNAAVPTGPGRLRYRVARRDPDRQGASASGVPRAHC